MMVASPLAQSHEMVQELAARGRIESGAGFVKD